MCKCWQTKLGHEIAVGLGEPHGLSTFCVQVRFLATDKVVNKHRIAQRKERKPLVQLPVPAWRKLGELSLQDKVGQRLVRKWQGRPRNTSTNLIAALFNVLIAVGFGVDDLKASVCVRQGGQPGYSKLIGMTPRDMEEENIKGSCNRMRTKVDFHQAVEVPTLNKHVSIHVDQPAITVSNLT